MYAATIPATRRVGGYSTGRTLRLASMTPGFFEAAVPKAGQVDNWVELPSSLDFRGYALRADHARRNRVCRVGNGRSQVVRCGLAVPLSASPGCSLQDWRLQALARSGSLPIDPAFFDALDVVLHVW